MIFQHLLNEVWRLYDKTSACDLENKTWAFGFDNALDLGLPVFSFFSCKIDSAFDFENFFTVLTVS